MEDGLVGLIMAFKGGLQPRFFAGYFLLSSQQLCHKFKDTEVDQKNQAGAIKQILGGYYQNRKGPYMS